MISVYMEYNNGLKWFKKLKQRRVLHFFAGFFLIILSLSFQVFSSKRKLEKAKRGWLTQETSSRNFNVKSFYKWLTNHSFQDLTDLLDLDKKGAIKIRNNVDNEVVIENLTEQAITSYDDALDLIQKGIS